MIAKEIETKKFKEQQGEGGGGSEGGEDDRREGFGGFRSAEVRCPRVQRDGRRPWRGRSAWRCHFHLVPWSLSLEWLSLEGNPAAFRDWIWTTNQPNGSTNVVIE
jgi:hypothetical protein